MLGKIGYRKMEILFFSFIIFLAKLQLCNGFWGKFLNFFFIYFDFSFADLNEEKIHLEVHEEFDILLFMIN